MQIGSEFPISISDLNCYDEPSDFSCFENYSTYLFSSGRGALRSILRYIGKETILLPCHICQSVIQACVQESYTVSFYSLFVNDEIEFDSLQAKLANVEVLLFLNYFGFSFPNESLLRIRRICDAEGIIVIEDTTHSFLSNPLSIGDYAFSSLRKWIGIPDGAIAYNKEQEFPIADYPRDDKFSQLRCIGMMQRKAYLSGTITDSMVHRTSLARAEEYLDKDTEIYAISSFSESLMRRTDFRLITEKRRSNYRILYSLLTKENIEIVTPELTDTDCPLFLVVGSQRRNDLRLYLSQHGIYCPIHWPIENEQLLNDKKLIKGVSRILSIPIDQRYGEEEMSYIADKIHEFVMSEHDL